MASITTKITIIDDKLKRALVYGEINTQEAIRKGLVEAGRLVTTKLLASTPVLTSRARSGWIKSAMWTGANYWSYVHLPGMLIGINEGSFRNVKNKKEQYLELTNRVPYIGLLERGRSKQAPNGILEKAGIKGLTLYISQLLDKNIRNGLKGL